MEAAGERSEFNIKLPLGAPLLMIFPQGYFNSNRRIQIIQIKGNTDHFFKAMVLMYLK